MVENFLIYYLEPHSWVEHYTNLGIGKIVEIAIFPLNTCTIFYDRLLFVTNVRFCLYRIKYMSTVE